MQILRRTAARKKAGISRTTEFRLLREDPTWPSVVELRPGLTGYYEHEIEAWLKARPRVPRPIECLVGSPP